LQGDFRIGDQLVQPKINSVEHDGVMHRLEPKVMQVLVTLAADHGEVVTREHLHSAVWPDVFVGEDVLIRAISEIRRVFDDDPKSPHIVQTVPKVGYRLIACVVEMETPTSSAQANNGTMQSKDAETPVVGHSSLAVSEAGGQVVPLVTSRFRWVPVLGLCVLLLAVAVVALLHRNMRSGASPTAYTSRPLTTYPGSQLQPDFSPDGNALTFVWTKPNDVSHIYTLSLGSESPVRLTSSTDQELNPAWSPDGRQIAFVRHSEKQSSINVISALGGSEREVYVLPVNSVWEYGGLSWAADGNHLIFSQYARAGAPSQLVELDLTTRAVRTLTNPPEGWDGDWMPAVSPDGRVLVFARGTERSVRDLYTMNLPAGTPHRLTSDGRLILGVTWSSDGSHVVFSSDRGGTLALWRVALSGGAPVREPVGTDDAYSPTIARRGDRLAYSHGSADWSIDEISLDGRNKPEESEILSSSEQDEAPAIAPTGDRFAFQSWRSGAQEIWISGINGSNPIQLTDMGTSEGSPAWSPDAMSLAFDARTDSFAHIYTMDATGARLRQVTKGQFNDIVPNWSPDGRWIYFGSNRSGSWQIWRTASDGSGDLQRVTSGEGMVARISYDGKWLYFTHFADAGLWRMPINGGTEVKVFDGPPVDHQDYWTIAPEGVYVLRSLNGTNEIVRLNPDTGETKTFVELKHTPTLFGGVAVMPGGRLLLFSEMQHAESGITLVGHYQ
jgi:Tol biopolymer transport system component/DNA-binding winged helix-turn-helix (wHTH) protein